MAARAAYNEFRRVFHDPGRVGEELTRETRHQQYTTYWSWYGNRFFDDKDVARYLARYKLYRNTRSIYNPVRRLVDFYAGTVYPGALTTDAQRLPEGIQQAIPFPDDTDPTLTDAIGQFWQWSNWQAQKQVFVRFGACAGDVLVELVDDLDRRKVTANIVWPALVPELTLDATGNVKAYTLEYKARDENGTPFTYKKKVDKDFFRTYKDDQPWDFNGAGAEYRNPYGFVPAVWARHTDLGGDFGASAIRSIGKLDELNSIAAHIHDQIHKVIGAPKVLWSEGQVGNLFKAQRTPATPISPEPEPPTANTADEVLLLKGPAGGRVDDLAGNLNLADALPYIEKLMREIEHDHPELSMYQSLRTMTNVSGRAATRLMGDVQALVTEAAANYDQQSIKLFQMAVAVGGWRANNGDWGPRAQLSRQQVKFLPYALDSYARGDLDLDILPRPIMSQTVEERIALERMELALEADRRAFGGPPTGEGQQSVDAVNDILRTLREGAQ